MTAIYWSAFGVSILVNLVYLAALFRLPWSEPIPDWWKWSHAGIQAVCFAIYFLTTEFWASKILDLVYFSLLMWLFFQTWDKRKKRKKPSRVAGRVVDLGHRLTVAPERG